MNIHLYTYQYLANLLKSKDAKLEGLTWKQYDSQLQMIV